MKILSLLTLLLGLGFAVPASAHHCQRIIKLECCPEPTKPGRAVGSALGVAASVAALVTGTALTATGFSSSAVDDQARKQQRGWGVGLMLGGTGGLITSAIALKRNRDHRKTTGAAPGHFRKDKPKKATLPCK
jgi:hypothetical protein